MQFEEEEAEQAFRRAMFTESKRTSDLLFIPSSTIIN